MNTNTCHTMIDGFYIESAICFFFGLLWLIWGRKLIDNLEKSDSSSYAVQQKRILTTGEQAQLPAEDGVMMGAISSINTVAISVAD